MTVTNRSDRDLYLGGATSCLLSFEVLDAAGMSVGAPPLLIRFCSTVVTNLRLAPGNSYEELAGWNGFVGASRFEELPDGEYQLRLWVRASYRRWHGGWRPAELAGLPMVTVEVEAN